MHNEAINDVKDAAKHYRDALGFNVIPLRAGTKSSAIKWKEFQERKPTDEELENFNFKNVGIITGKLSKLAVLDIDDPQQFEQWLDDNGYTLPDTLTVKTPNRGFHYYLRIPEGVEVRSKVIADGVLELKGEGSYVVAPPSSITKSVVDDGMRHKDSLPYEWLVSPDEVEIADIPDWLLNLPESRSGGLTAPVEATIPEGSRNNTLFSLARSLFRKGLNEVETFSALYAVNQNRCKPPLDDDELENIVRSAAKYERGELSPSSSLKGSDSDDSLPEVKMFKDMSPPSGPRPYIIDGVIFQGFAGAIYGDGGSAKSMLMMHMGQCVARGDDWLGFDTVKTNVLYLDFELDEDEQSRRAYQVAAGMGYTEPPEGLFYLSGAGYPTLAMFKHALTVCKEHDIGMVIVDSLGYALEGDAEASRDVLKFFREVEGTFRREGISLFVVDHQAKQQSGTRYQDKTMFGSVYKSNSIRSVFQVEPTNHEDGSLSVIVRHKKANFGPLLNPFGVQVAFDANAVMVDTRELDSAELAQERRLNSKERVLLALEDGSMYPEDISEVTGLELGTVKNALTAARKAGEVKPTGNRRGRGGSEEVTLTELSSLSPPLGDDDSDTYPNQHEVIGLAS